MHDGWFSPDNSLLLQCHSLTLLTFHPAHKAADEQDLQHRPGAGKRLHHSSAHSTHEDPAGDLSLMNTASVLCVPSLNSKSKCLSRAAVLLETPDHPRICGSAGDLNVSCLRAPFGDPYDPVGAPQLCGSMSTIDEVSFSSDSLGQQ